MWLSPCGVVGNLHREVDGICQRKSIVGIGMNIFGKKKLDSRVITAYDGPKYPYAPVKTHREEQ
jgi:hypothetical protein